MKRLAMAALALGLVLVVAAGCGGGKVPSGAIATVGGVQITKAQFDQYLQRDKLSAGKNGQPALPKAGTTAYNTYVASLVNFLVQQQVVIGAAATQKVTVTGAELSARLDQLATEYGSATQMYAAAKSAGLDAAAVKTDVKNALLLQKLHDKIVVNVPAPSEQQLRAYYDQHKAQFDQKASRVVRHILVKTKAAALKARALLVANDTNANWTKVASKYSLDTSTEFSGGNLGPIVRGQTVKPFDHAAFSLKIDTISQPVKSKYGWHILEVTAITPAKKSTYASAKAGVLSTLKTQAQASVWQAWLDKQTKADDIQYAAGYDPATLAPSPSASASPSPASSPK